MKVRRLSFLLMLSVRFIYAQQLNTGSRIVSMGNTGAALQDAWSLQANPAGIASLSSPTAAVTYQQNYPGTSLSTEAALLVYPLRKHVFGMSFQSFGFSEYKESNLGFAYARRFGESVFTAVRFNYHQFSIPAYGSAAALSVNAGFQYQPVSKLIIGAHVSNLSSSSYSEGANATIPVYLAVGSSYRFSEELLLATSVVVGNDYSGGDFRLGMEYYVLRQLAFRIGTSVHPFNQYAGVGYLLKHLSLDFAVSNHLVLGYNPQLSFAYAF